MLQPLSEGENFPHSDRREPENERMITLHTNGKVVPLHQTKDGDCRSPHAEGGEVHSTPRGVFHQILVTCAVLLLAAACGMPIGYSAVLLPQLYNVSEPLYIDVEMGSWIASVHSLATPIGSFASGPIMDRWGRKPALLLAIVPLLSGWIFLATASSHFLILVGRVVAGISVGLIAAPAQVLLAEIAEPRLRGLLIGAPFVSYSMGILLVYAMGSYLHWREVAWGGIILPILSFVALAFAPETPVYLARNNKLEQAARALTWLRGSPIQAKRELLQLIERFESETQEGSNGGIWKTLTEVSLIKPLIIINGFHILQILSGTYLVVFYAVDIISDMGGTDINTMQAAVLTAAVRLAFTFLYCFLLLVMPRRMMVIGSGIGSGISCLAISIFMYVRLDAIKTPIDTYVAAAFILLYIGTNTGFMTMPGIMIGELLPAKIRGRIAGYLFTVFNLVLFGVAKGFPYAKQAFRTQGLFLIFGTASFGASLLMYLMLPETKGRTLHDIEDYFQQRNWFWIMRSKERDTEQASDAREPLKSNGV
ncbi:facilitated trehalose transporter Tret1 isoform X2 [Toxorhynchites rutilus septentrionalis]|nr:facilitated trehalose transporter Tret1 isoform X2 [Toxorhynchites rutilus septentrionalis]XP_055619270.1 facilitated trehalose transporter Tret1 isoform X2 [Toxorhynchites rutilus septentrionalis]XP_055619272.1 facilitated trehalose transporter Tret1 isoform X2 [Toxorhynchites rutilus septentrionalis]